MKECIIMEMSIKEILEKALKVELRAVSGTRKYFEAKIEVIMNNEIDFVLAQDKINELPFKKNDSVFVRINTKKEVYTFIEKCSYINEGKRITVGLKFPTKINKEQQREFVRANMERDIIVLLVDKDENREIESLIKNFSIDLHKVKTIDISGGGLAFYSDIFMVPGLSIMIDMEFALPKLRHYRQKAEVIRCKEVNEKYGKYMIAVTFTDMSFAVQERINHFVFRQMRENRNQKKKFDNI